MPKRVPALSALQISRVRPHPTKAVELVDGAVSGLRLRILPSGKKSWSLAMRANGVMRRFEVGSGLGLSEARTKAEGLRRKIKEGADPTAEKRSARQKAISALEGVGTLGSVIDAYFTTGNGAGLKSGETQRKHLKTFFRSLLGKPASDVRSSQLQLVVDAHPARITAARAVAYVGPVLKWARKRDLMRGPFELEKPIVGAPRQRVLDEGELRKLLLTFDDAYGRCCMFLLLTAARRSEAVHATWSQIDLKAKTWTIPGEDRKDTRAQARRNGKPKEALMVPLSQQAVALLKETHRIERARRTNLELPKISPAKDRIFVTDSGGPLINWSRWLTANAKRSGVSGWSAHALRRTAATVAGDLGAAPHVIAAMLGHSNIGGQLVAGYNKSRYRDEHASIIAKIGHRIGELLERTTEASD
ncbi:MAG: tyrosine-type recombinase/integrase [Altererythrobacter sp.]|nr:tyrosine-type recombinase/integrase [Altererythrobacter sp.]